MKILPIVLDTLDDVGKRVIITIFEYLDMASIFLKSFVILRLLKKEHISLLIKNTLKQVYFTAFKSLLIIATVGLIIGTLLVYVVQLQGNTAIPDLNSLIETVTKFNFKQIISIIMQFQIIGPIIISLILIGRSGTAITTEIGYMKVSNEIEALQILGIDIYAYLLTPRIIGMIISTIILTVVFQFISNIGGALMASLIINFNVPTYLNAVFSLLDLWVIITILIQAFGFGSIISTVGVFQGLKVRLSPTEIPVVTTQSVVRSIVLCFIFFAYITVLYMVNLSS